MSVAAMAGGTGKPAGVPGPGTTARAALAWAAAFLGGHQVPDASLDAELLLAETLGVERGRLLLDPGKTLDEAQARRFRELVRRRGDREPLQYILGRQEFWSLEFAVCPDVLIPRPETEQVVEAALEAAREAVGPLTLVDMGCGSGNMAVALARELPGARVLAVDRSPAAAAATAAAARRHGVADRVLAVCADLFTAFRSGLAADIIVSNPPYIDREELDLLQPEVARHEPRAALDGGREGLEVIGRLLREARRHLRPGGLLVFEAGAGQADRIADMVRGTPGWASYEMRRDLAGHPRAHLLRRAGGGNRGRDRVTG